MRRIGRFSDNMIFFFDGTTQLYGCHCCKRLLRSSLRAREKSPVRPQYIVLCIVRVHTEFSNYVVGTNDVCIYIYVYTGQKVLKISTWTSHSAANYSPGRVRHSLNDASRLTSFFFFCTVTRKFYIIRIWRKVNFRQSGPEKNKTACAVHNSFATIENIYQMTIMRRVDLSKYSMHSSAVSRRNSFKWTWRLNSTFFNWPSLVSACNTVVFINYCGENFCGPERRVVYIYIISLGYVVKCLRTPKVVPYINIIIIIIVYIPFFFNNNLSD